MNSPLACILIVTIRVYRLIFSRITRVRSCLFDTSCSRHVEQVARESGFRAAVTAMRLRLSACRPGYSFEYDSAEWWITCRDGQRIRSIDVSPVLVAEAKACHVPVEEF